MHARKDDKTYGLTYLWVTVLVRELRGCDLGLFPQIDGLRLRKHIRYRTVIFWSCVHAYTHVPLHIRQRIHAGQTNHRWIF